MVAVLDRVQEHARRADFFLGEGVLLEQRRRLASLPPGAPLPERWRLYLEVATAELRLGNEERALHALSQARGLLGQQPAGAIHPAFLVEQAFREGVANMRLAETLNCCQQNTPQSCVLPLEGGAIHTRPEAALRAAAAFAEVLANSRPESKVHRTARWLLNIAYMATGRYPDEVPEEYLIPEEAYRSSVPFPRFENVAATLGLDTFNLSGGAIVDDFDGDDDLDVLTSTWDTAGQLHYYRNAGDGTFTQATAEAGLTGLRGGLNLEQADVDDDGDLDVLVLRGAWLQAAGQHPNSLLRNEGDGTFVDVTFEAGLGDVHRPTQTAAFADYDLDGDLDLYVGNETTTWPPSGGVDEDGAGGAYLNASSHVAPSQLFRNDGEGRFTDVAREAGVENLRWSKGVTWGDYDGDGDPDLYVSNYLGPNRLYRNEGDGTFTDVAETLGVTGPIRSFPTWFWDFDNDGDLDLYVSAFAALVSDVATHALGGEPAVELSALYLNDGTGRFTDVARSRGLTVPDLTMGCNFGDLDNDGFLDFYLGNGDPEYETLMPNRMWWNRGGERFVDVTYAGGFGHLQKGHAVAFADLDNDGDQDIYQQMGGAFPGDAYGNVLYENPGFGNHWLTIQLVGVDSNRSAIGARLRAEISEAGQRRSVHRHVNSGGSFGCNPLRQTLGLGKASRVEVLEVTWPSSGAVQVFRNVPVDRVIRIVEGQDAWEPVPVSRTDLGG